jgi:hypothetical protein
MAETRRWWIWLLVWLPILVAAILLNSTRPVTIEDARWAPQAQAYYPSGEGMFYAWVLPALGIVWTFARLLSVPRGERLGRRRMLWTWVGAILGMSVVLASLSSYISNFQQTNVGDLNAFSMWLQLFLFMPIVFVAIVVARAARATVSPLAAGLAGSAVVLLLGWSFYQGDVPEDQTDRLTGTERAQALMSRINSTDPAMRTIQEQERAAGLGYKVFAAGDRIDLEVVVPWPDANAPRRDQIVEFWNHPSPVLDLIPRPPWRAEWRTSTTDEPALVFSIRQPADKWTVFALGMASNEAEVLAQATWSDLRALTMQLLDEGYVPPAADPGPDQSREIVQVTLLRLAFQCSRLALVCNFPTARAISGEPASVAFGTAASRARDLRDGLKKPDVSLPAEALMSFADQVERLGANNQWRHRPDGCAVVDVTDEYALSNGSSDIRTHAAVAR